MTQSTHSPIDTSQLRAKNKITSEWIFPIRMENSAHIVWVENIVRALAQFKQPITQTMWEKCLSNGSVAAELPEEQQQLRQWWSKGWKEMPILPQVTSYGTPICEVRRNVMGENLDIVYPTIQIFQEQHKIKHHKDAYLLIKDTNAQNGSLYYKALRHMTSETELRKEPIWTLFTPDNKVMAHFVTKQELTKYLGCNRKQVDVVVTAKDHRFLTGYWIWKDDWGLVPVAPNGMPLPINWRQNTVENATEN